MKIWLVGASGMLGSAIFSILKKHGISAIGTTSKEVNISIKESIDAFIEKNSFSHIINAAAYTDVEKAEIEEEKCFSVNADGVFNLAVASRKMKAKMVHFSTDYVFSGEKNTPYLETDATKALSVYGKSKLMGEELLLNEAIDPLIIRTSFLFGFNGKNFVNTIVNLAKEKDEIKVVSDQIGRPTFSYDLANIVMKLMSYSGIYHFANDRILSWFEFAKTILDVAGNYFSLKCKAVVPVTADFFPSKVNRPKYSAFSTEKIESLLSISSPSLNEALHLFLKGKSQEIEAGKICV